MKKLCGTLLFASVSQWICIEGILLAGFEMLLQFYTILQIDFQEPIEYF